MAQDDLEHIPTIVATRDTGAQRPGGSGRSRGGAGRGGGKGASGGGSGIWARLFITLALAGAGAACAWAWQLQQQLQQSGVTLEGYVKRIADLEDRLSDTDEGLNNNTATMAVKIKELTAKADTNFQEIDKLWASAWRKNKAKIADLEKKTGSHDTKITAAGKSLTAVEGQLKGAADDIARLKSVAGDLDRLMSSARSNQTEVERVADDLNRINLELAKLGKRVEGNEEWVASINAFRRQMSAAMTDLRAEIQALRAAP
jgi:chromosome segregation ATPase